MPSSRASAADSSCLRWNIKRPSAISSAKCFFILCLSITAPTASPITPASCFAGLRRTSFYMAAAYAGLTAAIGEADRGPAQLPVAIADYATGVTAAMCVGFALLHRERTGEGQYIDCSLIDTYFNMHEVNVPKASLRGKQFSPPRMGSLHPDGGPTGVFRCGSGDSPRSWCCPTNGRSSSRP